MLKFLQGLCGDDSPPADDKLPPRPLIVRNLLFGFFYCDSPQLDETKDFVNFVHIPYDGQLGIDMAHQANKPVIMSVGTCGFAGNQYLGSETSRLNLRLLLTALADVDLLALYTLDEPHEVLAADLAAFCLDCRAVSKLPLMTIYSGQNNDRPAIESHDWIAVDDYGQGKGVLGGTYADLRSRMNPAQRYFYVPACAASKPGDPSPWRERPWVDEALADELCIGIMGFDFCGYEGKYPGLRDGTPELRQAWIDAGKRFAGREVP